MADSEFVSIPISEFLTGMKAPASLYLQLPSGRHLLLFKEGAVFDHERLKTYPEKKVGELWVLKKDYAKISSSSINFALKAVDQPFDANKKAFFPGDSEIDELYKIFQVLGTPNEDMWPGVTSLPEYKPLFPNWPPTNLADKVPSMEASGVDMLAKMLMYLPSDRISTREAIKHPYFNSLDKSLYAQY